MSLEKANYIEKHIKDFMSLSLYRFSLKFSVADFTRNSRVYLKKRIHEGRICVEHLRFIL